MVINYQKPSSLNIRLKGSLKLYLELMENVRIVNIL